MPTTDHETNAERSTGAEVATPLSALPFVECATGRQTRLWCIRASGNWAKDNVTGRQHADDLARFMRLNDNAALLGQVVKAIGAEGSWTGVEVGFFQRIADLAIC